MCPEVTPLALSLTFHLQALVVAHPAFWGCLPTKDLMPGDGVGFGKAF